jgi:hypothetical protein
VHPCFGQPLFIQRRGSEAVWVELQDGRCTRLPVEWTSLHPRPRLLKYRGRSVRLAPESLQALSRWVAARLEGEATAGRKLNGEGEKTREPFRGGPGSPRRGRLVPCPLRAPDADARLCLTAGLHPLKPETRPGAVLALRSKNGSWLAPSVDVYT